MDAPGTAVEQFFNQLIYMRLVSQIVVSDRQGSTILACFGPPSSSEEDGMNNSSGIMDDDMLMESNVVLSGARCFQNLDQLQMGVPEYISAQYHNAMVVQVLDGNCMLTLIGHRSQGHAVGGMLALLPQIRKASVYAELTQRVDECYH